VIDPTPPIPLPAALAVGTIRITDECVFLEHRGDKMLLVWLAYLTSWDPAARTITFRNIDGSLTTVRDGDPVELGGGGESPEEVDAAEWVSTVDWAAPPGPRCPTGQPWRVSDVALDR
jgi:hypothetical protein